MAWTSITAARPYNHLQEYLQTRSPSLLRLVRYLFWAIFPTFTLAYCECGYALNANTASANSVSLHNSALFTDLVETDFSKMADISKDTDWVRQAFNLTAERARGDYGEMFAVENVIANSPTQREGESHGGETGLRLIVRKDEIDNMIPVAEIDTHRLDMLWGTFRASMRMAKQKGTCAAFFWYFNDTQEIDMEFLSKDFDSSNSSYPVNLVLQSREAVMAGFDASKTKNFVKAHLPFDPTEDFHEYRIDYLPGRVFFYADGIMLAEIDGPAVPSSPGHLILQHWSNGNRLWSGGPPSTDAALTVRYVKAYFNSSTIQRQKDWHGRCKDLNAPGAVCHIPDITPTDDSAAGWFFMDNDNMTGNQTIYGRSEGSKSEQVWWLIMGAFLFLNGRMLALW
ncbi:beta-glucanase [Cladorrhinum samala]|uniref:Beta-glucanase n=1 Tax=Cladorrhinum samala TaxID=585594 RepID=A0AAV9HJ07_9PEZI|nr:beta-glucanase [Cladorrhinum samala]